MEGKKRKSATEGQNCGKVKKQLLLSLPGYEVVKI